jgi:dinuclear metal center YbgI/SA1388 family protein
MNSQRLTEILNKVASFDVSCEWDNYGAVLDCGLDFERALFALDASDETIARAKKLGCGAVVSHHPAIFGQGLKKLSSTDAVVQAAMNRISLFNVHTCWDAAEGGVNDVLCDRLGVTDVKKFDFGRMGLLSADSAKELAEHVKKSLNAGNVSYIEGKSPIEKVAVVGGAGGDYIAEAKQAGCDALITGEVKHHEMLLARQLGLNVVCAGHFATEVVSIGALRRAVQREAGNELECILFEDERDPEKTL